jgi:hypothetical protein
MWEADAQPDSSGQNSRWDTPILVSFSGTRRERALRVGVVGLATGCHGLWIMLVRYLDNRGPGLDWRLRLAAVPTWVLGSARSSAGIVATRGQRMVISRMLMATSSGSGMSW